MTPFHREKKTFVLLLLITLSLFIVPVWADLISPAITHVYFEKDGAPYNGSVQYTVSCYGYFMGYPYVTRSPGSYQPELIFRYSASCSGYGCEIYQPYYYHGHSDWCDLEGQTENGWFEIRNFSSFPYTRCDFVQYRVEKRWGTTREYYYETPEYFSCRQFMRKDSGSGAGTIWIDRGSFSDLLPANRTSMLLLPGKEVLYMIPNSTSHITLDRSAYSMDADQYARYLETCDPVTDPWCSGWILNGKTLKSTAGLRPLKDNATNLREYPCDRFLIKADPSLIMPFTDRDPWHHPCVEACNYTYEICESRFTIPSLNKTTEPEFHHSPEKTVPWTIMDRPYPALDITARATDSRAPHTSARVLSHVSRSPVESLYCSIVELLSGRCE